MKPSNIVKLILASAFLIYACFYFSKKPVTSEEMFMVKRAYTKKQLLDIGSKMFIKAKTLNHKN